MCRLFGMTSGNQAVRATFWLLDAPDSLVDQSHANPDGAGIGYYDPDGRPRVDKQPIAAFEDRQFASEAREISSSTYVAHIRHATTGALTVANTHPFSQHGRLFAHNGVIENLPKLERHLGADLAVVAGETDSERFFALITREIDRNDGDVGAGIRSAVHWIVDQLPLVSINFVLITATELWALRYPAADSLFVLERVAGGGEPHANVPLDQTSNLGTRVHCEPARDHAMVVVASERLDGDPGWREVRSGELIHVTRSLSVETVITIQPPAQ